MWPVLREIESFFSSRLSRNVATTTHYTYRVQVETAALRCCVIGVTKRDNRSQIPYIRSLAMETNETKIASGRKAEENENFTVGAAK